MNTRPSTKVYLLNHRLWFPDPRRSSRQGIVAIGGDLRLPRLRLAYRSGIFPWYGEGEPIIWWCPDPRFVLYPDRLKIRRSLRKTIRQGRFEIRYDTAFDRVIEHCAMAPRPDQAGTWITPEMLRAYIRMHERGLAHSVETWRDGQLVGGLYGVAMGPFFFGESMFHLEPNASKVALAALVKRYRLGRFIDCQVANPFFENMGAIHIPRETFLQELKTHIDEPNLWTSGVEIPEP